MKPDKVRDEAVRLYASGVASERVAAQLGVSPTSVTNWARKAGVPVRSRNVRDSGPIGYEGRWVLRGAVWRPEVTA